MVITRTLQATDGRTCGTAAQFAREMIRGCGGSCTREQLRDAMLNNVMFRDRMSKPGAFSKFIWELGRGRHVCVNQDVLSLTKFSSTELDVPKS
jgi:hypothetical protein